MQKMLKQLSLLNKDGTISITNSVVLIFVIITAIRTLFVGVHIQFTGINWHIREMDLSSALPLLFSLMNYSHKRTETNKFMKNNLQESVKCNAKEES